MITDMTQGKPSTILWKFSIPMLISVMFQQLYNIADSVIAGKFAGEDALAAVGASYPITMIFMAVAIGSNIGCSVIVSQMFGARNYEKMKTAITTTYCSCAVLSAVLTILGIIFCTYLMKMINTPENIFKDAALYLKIYIIGLTFLFLYNICTGIFNALGDSKTPLYLLIASSLGNIFLDILFVALFKWGVAGVAIATFIAQGISSIFALIILIKRIKDIKTTKKCPIFEWNMFSKIALVAIPSILQQSFISVGNLFIQGIINNFGSSVIAGYSAAIKLNTFTITSFTTLANGLSSFTAQNIGAGKDDRVAKGYKSGILMAMLVVIPFFIAFFFFGSVVMKVFLNDDSKKALEVGVEFLKIVSPFYFIVSIKLMADGVLRGSGVMRYFMITTFSDLILRVILSYILSKKFGTTGIWLSWPIGWTTAMIISVIFYIKGVWRKNYIAIEK